MLTRRETIPFAKITGISKFNPRAEMHKDVQSLAATIAARGLLHPLIVHASISAFEPDTYSVLDGGRRWCALLLDPPENIEVEIVDGDEIELREVALIPNVERKALHPVAEYEHFAALEEAGMDMAEIARDFGITARQVKQRLALGRLAPEIRAAWRAGDINADLAQAFTAGETHEAQLALFAEYVPHRNFTADDIRRKLRSDAIAPDEAEAVYVGAEDYLAVGGRIEDSLFEEEVIWRDGTLAKRLAREKMMREAEAIAGEEGWGFIWLEGEVPDETLVAAPDYLEAEKQRLDEIEGAIEEADWSTEDAQRATLALEDETQTILATATLRAIGEAERASYGIVVDLNLDGTRLVITRGVKERAADVSSGAQNKEQNSPRGVASERGEGLAVASVASRTARAKGAGGVPSAPAPDPSAAPAPSKAARAVLDEAMTKGFRSIIRTRPDIAVMIALADMSGVDDRADGFADDGGPEHELLRRIFGKPKDERLAILAQAPNSDCIGAFTDLIALSGNTRGVPLSTFASMAGAIARRGGNLKDRFVEHFDYTAYFAGATKDATLAAIRACESVAAAADAAKLKKKELAARAAKLTRDRGWLPEPLATWCMPLATYSLTVDAKSQISGIRLFEDNRSTAEAMVDAIAADEAREDKHRSQVVEFIKARCAREPDVAGKPSCKVKSGILFTAFNAYCNERGWPDLSVSEFGAAIEANGIGKHRYSAGWHYLGLKIAPEPLAAAAE